ncbi:hypothetical protein [Streptomyces virginiae]|uniref:hypothetical protein n=1 Tax=Streptomyces virginiae TaxID=1961 RepID=UPI00344BB6D4
MASRRHHRVKQTLRAALSALALTSTPDCHSLSVEVVGEGRFPPQRPDERGEFWSAAMPVQQ